MTEKTLPIDGVFDTDTGTIKGLTDGEYVYPVLTPTQVEATKSLVSGDRIVPKPNFAPRMRLGKEILSGANAATLTLQQAWQFPFDVYGFSIGLESNEAASYTLGPVKWALCGASGNSFGTALADVPNWHTKTIAALTFGGSGTPTIPARTAADMPAGVTWSDQTLAYIPAGQLLVVRGLHPASNWPYAPTGVALADTPTSTTMPIAVSWNVAGDRVTTPTSFGGNGTNFQGNLPFPFINVQTSAPTVTVGIIGDSTTTGTVGTGPTSYAALQYACDLLGTSRGVRFVPLCRGWSGKQASQFYQYALNLLASSSPPDILVYQVWSQNNTTAQSYEVEIALALDIVSRCRRQGIVPILLNAIPVNSWTAGSNATQEASRVALNAAAASWGVRVIDANGVLTDGGSPAHYLAKYGAGAHPYAQAYQDIAVPFAAAIASAYGG